MLILDQIKRYFEAGIKIIPISDKIPCIMDYYNLPWAEIKTVGDLFSVYDARNPLSRKTGLSLPWRDRVTGLAVILGPINKNLCCVDIDSNDPEIVEKLLDHFPSFVSRVGKKGCAFIGISDGDDRATGTVRFKVSGGFVEVFWSNRLITLPPSQHPDGGNYFWIDDEKNLLDHWINEELPVLSTENLLHIDKLVGSATTMMANANLPLQARFESYKKKDSGGGGRTPEMQKIFWDYCKSRDFRITLSGAIEIITCHDKANWPSNPFFLTGNRRLYKDDYLKNAIYFVESMSKSFKKKNDNFNLEIDSLGNLLLPNSSSISVISDWRDIIHFTQDFSLPDMDEDIMPDPVRNAISTIAFTNGVKPGPLFACYCAQFASALQGKVKIFSNKEADRFIRPNLAIVIMGPSGSKKSFIMNAGLAQIYAINANLNAHRDKKYLEKEGELQMKIEALVKQKKRFIERGEFDEADGASMQIAKVQDEFEKIKIPHRSLLIESATVQASIQAQMSTETGIVFVFDELNLLFMNFNKKGNEELRPFMLKGLSENSSYDYRTLARKTERIEDHFISLVGGIQNDVMEFVYQQMYKKGVASSNDGFLQRLDIIPCNTEPIVAMDGLGWRSFPKEAQFLFNAWSSPHVDAFLCEEAKEIVRGYLGRVTRLAHKLGNDPKAGFINKNQSKVYKYACIFEFMISGQAKVIGVDATNRSIRWLEYLTEVTEKIFSSTKGELVTVCEQMIEMIKEKSLTDGTTLTHWHQTFRQKNRAIDISSFKYYLLELQSRSYVRIVKTQKDSQSVVSVNPNVFKE